MKMKLECCLAREFFHLFVSYVTGVRAFVDVSGCFNKTKVEESLRNLGAMVSARLILFLFFFIIMSFSLTRSPLFLHCIQNLSYNIG